MESESLGVGFRALNLTSPPGESGACLSLGTTASEFPISLELVPFACSSAWALLPHKELHPSKLDWEVQVLELTLPAFEGLTFAILFQLKHLIKLMLALKF